MTILSASLSLRTVLFGCVGLGAVGCWWAPLEWWGASAPTRTAQAPKIQIGGAYLFLRERRQGATILDLRARGCRVSGSQPCAPMLSVAAIAHKVPGSTRSVVIIGDDQRSHRVAALLALRPTLKRVMLVPSSRLEAPDVAGVRQLTPSQFAIQWQRAGHPTILDFSEREEWEAAHLPHSRFIATSRLLAGERSFVPASREVYVSCAVGHRSQLAAQVLGREGVRVWNLRGGVLAWEAVGLPLEHAGTVQSNKDSS